MLERQKYKSRVAHAIRNKESCMSIIIDKMDQSHCNIPHLGGCNTFSKPIHQGITGVLEHGQAVTIYHNITNVSKGRDLTIYCILSQIEAWRKRNGCNPDTIYIQLDGGSENANQHVIAILEWLVSKRLARTIYFTRLPTGHTHEDIDAIFKLLWQWFRSRHIESLVAYSESLNSKA